MSFPERRFRRLRRTSPLRRLVAETRLSPEDFVAPLFVKEGIQEAEPIESLPGVMQHSIASLRAEVGELLRLGVPGVILFGIPTEKDMIGSQAWSYDGIVQQALRELRDDVGDSIVLMADLCLDEYTSHGHCGVLSATGQVDNDATLERYSEVALAQAGAGVDVCAPSGMMDGQVRAIRDALDAGGYHDTAILAYASKYASAMYGPFRDAVEVEIADGGDRSTYQQDWSNQREALAEIRADIGEGADMVMVKPAMTSLDVLSQARAFAEVPLAAYHVSGEYSMIHAAAERGWIDGQAAALEQLTVIKRAGADFILTYFAHDMARLLNES